MLTRLRAKGFKNLVDFELHLGPLTCIAGPNGVGKSNVFDAIRFLALLADRPFIEAARGVRGGADVTELFTSGGDGRMRLECDVLIPDRGQDDFGQPAEASHTYLTYVVALRLDRDPSLDVPRILLEHESLAYIKKGESAQRLGFPHSKPWREGVLSTSSRRKPFISVDLERGPDRAAVKLHSDRMRTEGMDKRGGGRPTEFHAAALPRTVLSSAQNADETRTAVLVRQELRRWRILQLEPTALRRPDEFQSEQQIDAKGGHVPATLYRLAEGTDDPERVFAQVGNRLSELVDDVRSVRVERDDARRLFRLMMRDRYGVDLPASSLSDGTLRFIALAIMEQDSEATGVLCLEEAENGIHPARMNAMIGLLEDMAVDTDTPVDVDNPLRQVILSTHSPLVASAVGVDDLVFAETRRYQDADRTLSGLEMAALPGRWRTRKGAAAIPLGNVLQYLGALQLQSTSINGRHRVWQEYGDQLPLPYVDLET